MDTQSAPSASIDPDDLEPTGNGNSDGDVGQDDIVDDSGRTEPPKTYELAGIYCSCGPTNSTSSSVFNNIEEAAYLDGVLVRIPWAEMEPSPGVYDWTLLDQQLGKAKAQGLHVTFALLNGYAAPPWLESEGADMLDYIFRGDIPRRLPIPWDETYLRYLTNFITALGARYSGEEALQLVHMTNSTTNGFEMQYFFDAQAEADFYAKGYSESVLINSWKRILDAYSQAFDDTRLDLDVHPVLGSPTVAEQVVAYGQAAIGARFGVFGAWWSRRNAEVAYPEMYSLLLSGAASSFAGVQLVGTASTRAYNEITREDLLDAIKFALQSGIYYIEVWNQDLLNTDISLQMGGFHTSVNNAIK
ncbi:beta-galactosidase [Hahella sp. KA22]|uniref:beta-galactosidase n=1 Tax=Hahella sp. KA22 TaxID=1628392 RepID=UPI0013E40860|nr:beta-galactosidase [Hahella sp. KA22]